MTRQKMFKAGIVALTVVALLWVGVFTAGATHFTLGVSVNPTGAVSQPLGVATLGGTMTCNVPATVFLSGQLTQPVGRKDSVQGSFFASVPCAGVTPWSATVSAQSGRFGGGWARASVFASACVQEPYPGPYPYPYPYPAPFNCAQAQAQSDVHLSGKGK